MKTLKPYLIVASLFLTQLSFASDDKHEEGEKLFKANCDVCHGSTGGMDMSKRLAPPVAAVRMHYINAYPDETSFVEAVTSWVEKQDESKSHMRGAIQKFKIMPPLSVPKEDAAKIAAYIYAGDIEKLEGFEKHVEEEHGKKGMGMGLGNMQDKGMGQGMHQKGMGMGNMQDKGMGQGLNQKGMGMGNMQGKGMGQGMHQKGMGMHNMQGKGMHGMGKGMSDKQNRKGMIKRVMQERMGGMRAKMMQQLNLSPQQSQQMQALIQEKENRIRPVKMEMRQIDQAIQQLDTTSPNYKEQIFSLADQKAKRVHRMVIEKGEIRMKIESVLSPEQRNKFKQLRQQRREKKQSRMMKHMQ